LSHFLLHHSAGVLISSYSMILSSKEESMSFRHFCLNNSVKKFKWKAEQPDKEPKELTNSSLSLVNLYKSTKLLKIWYLRLNKMMERICSQKCCKEKDKIIAMWDTVNDKKLYKNQK
jgi:hypothetical protein